MEEKIIMAIDDNPVLLSAVEKALQDTYKVVLMTGAERALKYLGKRRVDLILLDVQMPGMSGVEALRELRKLENGADVPVILLSGTRDDEADAEGRRLGIADYMLKPFEPEDLKQRIKPFLQ